MQTEYILKHGYFSPEHSLRMEKENEVDISASSVAKKRSKDIACQTRRRRNRS